MPAEPVMRWSVLIFMCGIAAALTLALTLALAGSHARGQSQMPGAKASDIKVQLETYDPPNEAQVKTLLEGANADWLPGGRILFADAKLTTFSTNGTLEMVALTPHCVFDSNQKTVSSPGPLQVRTADGRFFLEGTGFLLQLTNSNLTVSNGVRTVIHGELTDSYLP